MNCFRSSLELMVTKALNSPSLALDAKADFVDDFVSQRSPAAASEARDLPDAGLPDPRVQQP